MSLDEFSKIYDWLENILGKPFRVHNNYAKPRPGTKTTSGELPYSRDVYIEWRFLYGDTGVLFDFRYNARTDSCCIRAGTHKEETGDMQITTFDDIVPALKAMRKTVSVWELRCFLSCLSRGLFYDGLMAVHAR